MLQSEIMPFDPAAKRRQVVGVEGRQRFGRIMLGRAEASVGLALEQHDAVGPEAPARHRVAKAFRHGAEVFADDDATRLVALLRDHPQRVLERIVHIGALPGGATVRDQEQPFQSEHMIEPHRAGVPHSWPASGGAMAHNRSSPCCAD